MAESRRQTIAVTGGTGTGEGSPAGCQNYRGRWVFLFFRAYSGDMSVIDQYPGYPDICLHLDVMVREILLKCGDNIPGIIGNGKDSSSTFRFGLYTVAL